ncbi:hypothetical protein [Streptomyces sp. NPDC021608]|uniref:hypothetical protein n=1 Tax=Streptomyces sp. NPDC021608 TaxID=3154903 RepID=UPI0033CC8791
MDIRTVIEALAEEAEGLIRDQVWVPTSGDRTVAAKAAADLHAAVGAQQSHLSEVDRLEDLREALAAVAIALARGHGPLAWFLGAAADTLRPILHWRAMAAEGPTFGAVTPTLEQYTEAEDAVRRLQRTLASFKAA